MAIFYPPPGPYIGGRQPYDPGRRVTPPQTTQNPPFGQLVRLEPWFNTVIQSWVPPAPVYLGGGQPYDPARYRGIIPTAPVVSLPPVREVPPWMGAVLQNWQVPAPQPQRKIPQQVTSVAAAAYVPPPEAWINSVLQSWNLPPRPPAQLPQLQTVSGPVTPDQPYPFSRIQPYPLGQSWQTQNLWSLAVVTFNGAINGPTPDQPTPVTKYQQQSLAWWYIPWIYPEVLSPGAADFPPAPTPDNPPRISYAVFDSVIQSWVPGPPLPVQRPQEQVISGPVAADNPPPSSLAVKYTLIWESVEVNFAIQMPQQSGQGDAPTIDDPKPNTEWQAATLAWWYVPWRYPQTLKQLVNPPTPDNPTPLNDAWMQTVLQAWVPPFKYPQTLEPGAAVFPPPPTPDDPKPNTHWQQPSLQWWYVPWLYPQTLGPVAPLIPVPDNPAPNAKWQQAQSLAWWYVPWIYPQTLGPIAADIPQPDNPPVTSRTLFNLLNQLWVPGPPQPYQLHQTFQIPTLVPDNPPIVGTNWMNTVLQAWVPPPPLPHQLLQDIVVPGEEPPVPPEPPPGPSGGGPAWYYAYGCDEDDEDCYERAEEFLEDLGEEEKKRLEIVVQKAVVAVKEDKPAKFRAAERAFTKEVEKVSGIVKADIKAIWRAEVEHRIREEEEEMTILLAYFF